MAFIRAKRRTYKHKPKRSPWHRDRPESTEHAYYSVVESYRDDKGRVRQRTLAYLGKHATVQEALREAVGGLLAGERRWATYEAKWRAELAELEGKPYGRETDRYKRIAKVLEYLPARIEERKAEVVALRQAADVLGITDAEELVLPGTAAYTQVEARVEEAWRHHTVLRGMLVAAGRA